MRIIILILLMGTFSSVLAQDALNDLYLIDSKVKDTKSFGEPVKRKKFSPVRILYNVTLGFYQNQISAQWGANCAFELTCSRFSKEMVQEFGLTKGFFLTFDRISRCSKISVFETLPIRITKEGKIIDQVSYYSVK